MKSSGMNPTEMDNIESFWIMDDPMQWEVK